jgi:hypothetical protein
MRSSRTLRRVALAAIFAVAFLFQGTWALAGVTGGITGVVHDDHGAPVADASVTASSPSETTTATTDAQGHFVFLVLDPDTYTLSVHKDGYTDVSVAGNTVQADQTQQVVLIVPRLTTIAHIHSNAASLVKPGVGGDLYNVTPAQQQADTALGGGGNLESAYSAISSVPGLTVGTGGMGWNQSVVIHGQNPFTTGFEYDGVPVDRAFDQYNTSTESSLGLQELQIYTGGGPASVSSSGISGFINQVIKTGTYPGYATLTGGLATEAFYHEAKFEAGGATPDRNFSYYVGISGYDQASRACDQQDCASLTEPGGELAGYAGLEADLFPATGQGVEGLCTLGQGFLSGSAVPATSYLYGCLDGTSGIAGVPYITDRENVVNLHLAVPRHDGQRDDFQILWSDSALQTFVNNSPQATGPGVNQFTIDASGNPYVPGVNYPAYTDSTTYNLPFGSVVNPGTGGPGTPYENYYMPDTPSSRGFMSEIPSNLNDVYHNDVGIVKLQWEHPFNDNAFMRVYVYSMFSDWTEDGAVSSYTYDFGPGSELSPDYDLITHTTGGQLAFEDQINDQNLVQFTANYTTATTSRWNNTGMVTPTYLDALGAFGSPYDTDLTCPGGPGNNRAPGYGPNPGCSNAASSPIGLISDHGGTFTCYGIVSQAPTPCYGSSFETSAYNNAQCTYGESDVSAGACLPAISGAAAAGGAQYSTLWNGNASASLNTVQPQFADLSLSDEFRPNDRLTVDVSGRYDNYNYVLNNTNNVQNSFYAQIIQNYLCVNPATDTPALTPLGPGTFPPPTPAYSASCGAGYVHPNGVGGNPLFTDASPPNYDMKYWEGRVSATYQTSPDTVWRFSAGRYAEPPLTASVQYFNADGNNTSQWANFTLFGFLSPFHAIPGETSGQYDLSLEHHFRGTDVSVKLTPFYSTSSNWEQQYFIGAGYVTQIPIGQYQNYGFEASLQAGDFARNGLSGELTFTYTNATVRFQSLVGQSQVLQLNSAINAYNCYTEKYYSANTSFCNKNYPTLASAGGAAPCYTSGTASSCTGGGSTTILNPYYNNAPQPTLNPTGWYPASEVGLPLYFGPSYGVEANGFYSPYASTLILNFRHDKWAITPSLQFESGAHYGSPMDTDGIDPEGCSVNGVNQGSTGRATTNNPYDCDYTTLAGLGGISPWGYFYVPNPQTGTFASLGEYTEPSIVVGNIMASYDISPRVRLTITAASLWHTCFGGSKEPWTTAYPANSTICGYDANGAYDGGANGQGWYVGSSPYDTAANGVSPVAPTETESYGPSTFNGVGSYFPFNLYIQAQIHL